jgi:pimeloyl-ACP methyl ester carboxylesterase
MRSRLLSGLVGSGLLLAGGVWVLKWSSEHSGPELALVPNEPELEDFSRHKKYLALGGWQVAYIDQGSGPPVVLLHGCPFHAFQWRDLIPQLTPDRRVLAPDLLGLGDTQVRLDDDYRLPQDVTMVVGFLDALGIEKADFVAADHGAATLQLLMRDHPERIRRAVITNAEAYDQWPSKPEIPYLRLVVNPWLGPLFRLALHSTWVQREVFGVAVHREEAFTDEVLNAYARAHIATPERWARLQRFFRWQLDPEHNRITMDAVPGLRRFEQPTLLLWGKQDTNFGPEIAERLAGDIAGVVAVEYLEHSAHMPFQEEPERYGRAVRDFLDAADDALHRKRRAFREERERTQETASR